MHLPSLAPVANILRPARLSTQSRVLGAVLLVLAAVFVLAAQQALNIVRQDASAALRVQATAQLAALSQAVAASAVRHDYQAVQAQLRIPIDQGNLRQVEYTAPDGRILREQAHQPATDRPDWFARLTRLVLPVIQQDLILQGAYYGSLRIQPSSHAYEDFLWHLGSRLFFLLGLAILLLGWLIHTLLRINLKDLTRLCATARRIEAGDYSARIPVRASSPPELQESARVFNTMSAALERLLTDLGIQQKALDSAASVSESDLAGNLTRVNDLFCILSGYTREELIGKTHRILRSDRHDPAFPIRR